MINKCSSVRDLIIVALFLYSVTVSALEHVKINDVSPSVEVPTIANDSIQPIEPIAITPSEAIQNLLQYAMSHDGASYRRGGSEPDKGFDCSGFVRHVFDHVGKIALPHNANAISKMGRAVNTTELAPGDLVFFRRSGKKVKHIGIYLGDNQFIHAASRRTGRVMISKLVDRYWSKHIMFGRRFDLSAQESQKTDHDPLLLQPSNGFGL
ncbi:MAG: C40 family peptidase [Gallionellaceae bacterium]